MGIHEDKLELIQWLIALDNEHVIKELLEYRNYSEAKEISKTMVIGYRPNGKTVVKEGFLKLMIDAERNLNKGAFVTLEELENISDEW